MYEYSRPGEILRCPWHGWEFDVKTGQSWYDPAKTRVRQYPVTLEAGGDLNLTSDAAPKEMQKGPYVAETFPVSIEKEYVIVEI